MQDESKYLLINGDEPDAREQISNLSSDRLRVLIGDSSYVLIDEAQLIPDIGISLKRITDYLEGVRLIVSGSSALELANTVNEPLTGRKLEYQLFPLSFGTIKKPSLLDKLLKALALQIGSEVSYHELAQITGADKETVERYIDLLEKAFIIFRLNSLSRNLRNEIKKGKKIYFCDNGIRNAVIGNFQPFEMRTDKGALWENYIISERIKMLNYHQFYGNYYFWRTFRQQEIDFIEEQDARFSAFEFKLSHKKGARFSRSFTEAYPLKEARTITPGNLEEFLLEE
ncbi:MAG: ATP-binding protein [Bacteroidota bacterium]|nr:ATP-binding protein [Bacteroidota bacterium]